MRLLGFFNLKRPVLALVFLNGCCMMWAGSSFASNTSPNLAPYKAYYTLSLASSLPDSSVSEIEGQMIVEFQDMGNGWVLQQNSELVLINTNSQETQIRWNYVTWESKNGKDFRFNMRKEVDGVMEDDLRGSAHLKHQTLKITFKRPYYKVLKLKENVLFPVQHLQNLLHMATKGENFISNKVFDGSSFDGPVAVNTFIGRPHQPIRFQNLKHFKQDFKDQRFWPIRFAMYQPQSDRESPDLESAQHMLPNGLPLEYLIDYSEFKIKAVLNCYELLGASCAS